MMDYEKLKSELKGTGHSWAMELAKEIGYSRNLVYQVCSGTKTDCHKIIDLALRRIEAHGKEIQEQELRLEKAAGQKELHKIRKPPGGAEKGQHPA